MTKIILLVLVSIFSFYTQISAQESSGKPVEEIIENSVARLQQKVLLDDSQQKQIIDLITEKAGDGKLDTDDIRIIQEKINSLLEPKQKAKYDIVKDEWLKTLVKSMPDAD